MTEWIRSRIILAAWLLVVLGLTTVAPATTQASSHETGIQFIELSAEAEFPNWMLFRFVVESDEPIEAVELYWRPANAAVLSGAFPTVDPATRIELAHEVDMSVSYRPPGLDIVYFWRIRDVSGQVAESEPQTLFYMDQSQDWRSRNQGEITLFWYSGSDAFADQVLDTATRTAESLRVRFGVETQQPIRIVLYGSDRDFARVLPPNSAEWIGGQAYPGLGHIIALLAPDRGGAGEIGRMIPHEVSHVLMSQATLNPFNAPPNWLDEGLAVYSQETEDTRLANVLASAVDDGRLIPVRALNSSFPLDAEQALLSYAESWSIVSFIVDVMGEQALADLIAIYRTEVSHDQAVEQALGMTIEELDASWKRWLGYDGDQPPPGAPGQVDDDDTELTETERLIAMIVFGVGAGAGFGLFVIAILKLRRMRRG